MDIITINESDKFTIQNITGKKYILLGQIKCIRCGLEFFPKVDHKGHVLLTYARCPSCKSQYWNTERIRKIIRNQKRG